MIIPPFTQLQDAVLDADDDTIPEESDDPDQVDWSKWRGLIHADNLADLEFSAYAKGDIAALIRESSGYRRWWPIVSLEGTNALLRARGLSWHLGRHRYPSQYASE